MILLVAMAKSFLFWGYKLVYFYVSQKLFPNHCVFVWVGRIKLGAWGKNSTQYVPYFKNHSVVIVILTCAMIFIFKLPTRKYRSIFERSQFPDRNQVVWWQTPCYLFFTFSFAGFTRFTVNKNYVVHMIPNTIVYFYFYFYIFARTGSINATTCWLCGYHSEY